jgi:serine/threonine protein kinase
MGNSNGKPVIFTDQVNLNHFRLLRVVGKGAFGKVRIVERKDNGDQFALKYIRKDEGWSERCLSPSVAMLMRCNSGTIRECAKYYSRATDARALAAPFPLQSALQLPGH